MADDERSATPPGDHPSPAVLRAFAASELGPRDAKTVVRHLVRGCRACAESVRAELARPADEGYDGAIDRAAAVFASRQDGESRRERGAWRQFAARWGEPARARLERRVAELSSLSAAEQCRTLLTAARELRQGDPRLAGLLSAFGIAVCAAAAAGSPEEEAAPGGGAGLWAELGNSWRIAGDLRGADSAFGEAHRRFAGSGCAEGALYAEILELHGRLRHDQGRFEEAAEMLGWAHGLFERERGGGAGAAGRARIARGIALGAAGAGAAGAGCLLAGLELADPFGWAMVEGLLQLALAAVAMGRQALARSLGKLARQRVWGDLEPWEALRRRWLEGELAAALGEYLPAARALREARAGLEALGRPHEALQVALAVAALELEHGRAGEAEIVVGEALAGAGRLRLAAEGREALASLAAALRRRQADAASVRAAAARVMAAGTPRRGSGAPGAGEPRPLGPGGGRPG